MRQLQRKFKKKMGSNLVDDAYQSTKRPVLDCMDIPEQPTYYQMFHIATGSNVKGDVVIVENADQAFDDSVRWAKHIKNTTVLALSTWGFHPDTVPSPTKEHFFFIHGNNPQEYEKKMPARCWEGKRMHSWDGFVFHKQLFAGQLKAENFQRPTVKMMNESTHENAFFKMNESGGENAAMWALLEGIPESMDVNGCTVIQTWHFHGAKKMHAHSHHGDAYWFWRDGDGAGHQVPTPHRIPSQDSITVTGSFGIKPAQRSAPQM
eukprot:Sro138_g064780.2  (263) ;mRNA; r:63840-64628